METLDGLKGKAGKSKFKSKNSKKDLCMTMPYPQNKDLYF